MADDWEDNDWESDNFKPVIPAATKPSGPTAAAIIAPAAELDLSKFQEEDADLEKEEKKHFVPQSQPKKKEEKKYLRDDDNAVNPDDVPLDDPIAEKLRQQRLVEQADFAAARELFGEGGQGSNALDATLPKTVKEFEDFAAAITARYVTPHRDSKNYKAFLKALFKAACGPLPSQEIKDLETSLAGLRSDKFKAEQAEAQAKKGVKKQLNVGKGAAAGLDEYIYDDAGQGDDYDFM